MILQPEQAALDGRFRILRLLGEGAISEVYLAEQLSLSRRVAIKVFRPELGVQDGVEPKLQEAARALAAVDHPGVLRVLDFGRSGRLLFLVTEYGEGAPLGEQLRGEPLLPDRAVELVRQAAEGLAAIHRGGLVHGGLKPEKVIVASKDGRETARLFDFGVARLVDPDLEGQRLTLIGKAIGDPRFLSPEQAAGAPAGPASDVYALGLLAYEMLSGAPVFTGETRLLLERHQREAPRPLAEAAPHLVDHPRILDPVMRCLLKDPAKRPTAAELAQQLGRAPEVGEPTLFMESMQVPVPPPLPPASKPPAAEPAPASPNPAPPPAAASPDGLSPALAAAIEAELPKPLLPSIPMPVPTPPPGTVQPVVLVPGAGAAAPRRASPLLGRGRLVGAIAVVGLILAAAIGLILGGDGTAARVRDMLEQKRPVQAIDVVDRALPSAGDRERTALKALKAYALHLNGQHKAEAELVGQLPPGERESVEALTIAGLAEDFGAKEEASVRTLLRGLPRQALHDVLEKLAAEPPSPRQWGALRYLDLEEATGGLDLAELYANSLESPTCAVRKAAARRLGQLRSAEKAVPALVRLKYLAPGTTAEKSCGQDEAAATLQAIEKRRDGR